MKRSSILAVLVLLAGAAPVYAQSAEDRAACEPDVWRLCAGHIPNVGAITGCLKSQKHALSPACRMVVDGSAARRRRAAEAR